MPCPFAFVAGGSSSSSSSSSKAEGTLATALRTGTSAAHRAIERSPGVRLVLRGESDFSRLDYVRWLIMLTGVYSKLEERLAAATESETLAPFHSSGLLTKLARTDALHADIQEHLSVLEQHQGTTLSDLSPESSDIYGALEPAQRAAMHTYIDRLATLPDTLLLAHAHTRYLGDLSGGQHILRRVQRRFPASSPAVGFDFYAFDDAPKLKAEFRAALDCVPVSTQLTSAIVDEANHAFLLNATLFDALVSPDLLPQSEEVHPLHPKILAKPPVNLGYTPIFILSAASALLLALRFHFAPADIASLPAQPIPAIV